MKKVCLLLLALPLIPWNSQANIKTGYHAVEKLFKGTQSPIAALTATTPKDEHQGSPRKSQFADVYYNYGNFYINSSQYAIAIKFYDQAIALNPSLADAYYNRGNAHSYLGIHQQAKDDYSQAIRIRPNYIKAYHNRGLAYLALQQLENACGDFKKACELGNCSALSWTKEKGICH